MEEEATGAPVPPADSVVGVGGGVGDSEVLGAGAGAAALWALEERPIDWNSTPARSASRWTWTSRPAWSPSAGTALPSTTKLR